MGRVCVFTRKCPAPAWALARDLPALIHWQRGVSVAVPATATNTPTHTTISTSHALTASHITRAHAFSRTRHSHRVHATPLRLHHYVCTSIAWAPLNSPIRTIISVLQVRDPNGSRLWWTHTMAPSGCNSSSTKENECSFVTMQDDGNVVMRGGSPVR